MSLSAMTWAVEAPIEKPTAKLALVCLADHADEDGACFPSQKSLAAKVGVSERSLRDALAWLESEGFITRTPRFRKDGSRTSDAFQLPEEAYRKNFPHPRKETQEPPEKSAGLTTFEPPTEPVTTAAPARKYDEILDKCLAAAGIDGFRDERNPKLASIAPILGLLDAGYELDVDVLPVIRAKCAGGFKPRSWSYFVEPVRGEKQDRAAAASKPKPPVFAPKPKLEGYETVDRYRDPALFAACEQLHGKPISVMIQKSSFPSDLVERARQKLRSAA